MSTTVHWNGSAFYGEEPAPMEALLSRLAAQVLDPALAPFAGDAGGGLTRFFGNFCDVSHAFSVETDDPALVEALSAAVRANAATVEYAAAERAVEARRLERIGREAALLSRRSR